MRQLVFPSALLTDASRAYVLNLMEHVTPSQAWGISGGVPPGVTIALKTGFSIVNGLAQINSMCPSAVVFQFGVNIGTNNPGYNCWIAPAEEAAGHPDKADAVLMTAVFDNCVHN